MKKFLTLLLATTMGLTNLVPAFAAEVSDDVFTKTQLSISQEVSEPLESTSIEMLQELDEASRMLGEGLISQAEYDAMLLDIYQINTAARASDDEYYPEVQAGYINHEGVVYLYEEGLPSAKSAEIAISSLISYAASSMGVGAVGWGLTAVSMVAAYGGKSDLEKAVDEAYYAHGKKGIKVYYQIHHSVQSYNRVRYVVE